MVLCVKLSVIFGEITHTYYVRGWMLRGDLRVKPTGQYAGVSFTSSSKIGGGGKNKSK
jgi:hypothetical protein